MSEEIGNEEIRNEEVNNEEMNNEDTLTQEVVCEDISVEKTSGQNFKFKWNAYFTATSIFTLAALFMASRGDYLFALVESIAIILCFRSGMRQMKNEQ